MSRPLGRLAAALVAGSVLASCATDGRVYDRGASDTFRIGTTTADQAAAALGVPDQDIRRTDGLRVLVWKYRTLKGLVVREHILSARFDRQGRMTDLHNPGDGQIIDPF